MSLPLALHVPTLPLPRHAELFASPRSHLSHVPHGGCSPPLASSHGVRGGVTTRATEVLDMPQIGFGYAAEILDMPQIRFGYAGFDRFVFGYVPNAFWIWPRILDMPFQCPWRFRTLRWRHPHPMSE